MVDIKKNLIRLQELYQYYKNILQDLTSFNTPGRQNTLNKQKLILENKIRSLRSKVLDESMGKVAIVEFRDLNTSKVYQRMFTNITRDSVEILLKLYNNIDIEVIKFSEIDTREYQEELL